MLSHVWLFATPQTSPPGSSARGISQARYWSGLPFPAPGIFPAQGFNLRLLCWQVILYTVPPWKSQKIVYPVFKWNLLEMGVKSFTIKIWRQISHIRPRNNKYRRPLFSSHCLENQYETVSSLFLTLAHSGKKTYSIFPRIFSDKITFYLLTIW